MSFFKKCGCKEKVSGSPSFPVLTQSENPEIVELFHRVSAHDFAFERVHRRQSEHELGLYIVIAIVAVLFYLKFF